jgi:hypothetical protein
MVAPCLVVICLVCHAVLLASSMRVTACVAQFLCHFPLLSFALLEIVLSAKKFLHIDMITNISLFVNNYFDFC